MTAHHRVHPSTHVAVTFESKPVAAECIGAYENAGALFSCKWSCHVATLSGLREGALGLPTGREGHGPRPCKPPSKPRPTVTSSESTLMY